MGIISSIIATLFGCGLLGSVCVAPPLGHGVAVRTYASSASPNVTVVTDINGSTTKKTMAAPYGVQTSIVERSANGETTASASTSALTAADETRMQQQLAAMQQQMDGLFASQQQVLRDVFGNFPQTL